MAERCGNFSAGKGMGKKPKRKKCGKRDSKNQRVKETGKHKKES